MLSTNHNEKKRENFFLYKQLLRPFKNNYHLKKLCAKTGEKKVKKKKKKRMKKKTEKKRMKKKIKKMMEKKEFFLYYHFENILKP